MARLVAGLVLVGVFAGAAFCEAEGEAMGLAELEEQLELQEVRLELEARELGAAREKEMVKVEFELKRRMAELEVEGKQIEVDRGRREIEMAGRGPREFHRGGHVVILAGALILRILLSSWVYQDIKQRGKGSGIWVVVALIGGLLGTLVYGVIRMGDGAVGNVRKKTA